jgi:hypothetical protein
MDTIEIAASDTMTDAELDEVNGGLLIDKGKIEIQGWDWEVGRVSGPPSVRSVYSNATSS